MVLKPLAALKKGREEIKNENLHEVLDSISLYVPAFPSVQERAMRSRTTFWVRSESLGFLIGYLRLWSTVP